MLQWLLAVTLAGTLSIQAYGKRFTIKRNTPAKEAVAAPVQAKAAPVEAAPESARDAAGSKGKAKAKQAATETEDVEEADDDAPQKGEQAATTTEDGPEASAGNEIVAVKIVGDKSAEVVFVGAKQAAGAVKPAFEEGRIVLSMPNTALGGDLAEGLSLKAPHALIESIESEVKETELRIIIRPKDKANLNDRVTLSPGKSGMRMRLGAAGKPAELPAAKAAVERTVSSGTMLGVPFLDSGVVLLFLALAAVGGGYAFYKIRLRKRAIASLDADEERTPEIEPSEMIQPIAHCPVESKTGVKIVKVGKEYLLLGVTPYQIKLLAVLAASPEDGGGVTVPPMG